MTASIRLDHVHRFVRKATRHSVGYGRVLENDTRADLLLGLIIVIVIIVLLLSQGDPGVGMAL
jgi:hypothetical protein